MNKTKAFVLFGAVLFCILIIVAKLETIPELNRIFESDDKSIINSSHEESTVLKTKLKYIQNDEIPMGNKDDIIVSAGVVPIRDQKTPYLILGIYENKTVLLNQNTNDLLSVNTKELSSSDPTKQGHIVFESITGNRGNKINYINMYDKWIVWSECKYADIIPDETLGSGWQMYLANLDTNMVTMIDKDNGVKPPDNIQYPYLCPSKVSVSEHYLSYLGFEYNSSQEITAVVKLYNIDTGKTEIIDYLNQDMNKYAFGFPSVYDNKLSICRALVNPDGTYTGFVSIYDIDKKTMYKLETIENIINPVLYGRYLIAEGKPNKSFYDSEICIYDMEKKEWVYKINHGFSQYSPFTEKPLGNITVSNGYVAWNVHIIRSQMLFNTESGKLYTIVNNTEDRYIDYSALFYGNLFYWIDRNAKDSSQKPVGHYIILKDIN